MTWVRTLYQHLSCKWAVCVLKQPRQITSPLGYYYKAKKIQGSVHSQLCTVSSSGQCINCWRLDLLALHQCSHSLNMHSILPSKRGSRSCPPHTLRRGTKVPRPSDLIQLLPYRRDLLSCRYRLHSVLTCWSPTEGMKRGSEGFQVLACGTPQGLHQEHSESEALPPCCIELHDTHRISELQKPELQSSCNTDLLFSHNLRVHSKPV